MTDTNDRDERIAIRVYCAGMTERRAIEITDAEQNSLIARIKTMWQHQREHAKPVPLHTPRHEPILDRKTLSGGE